MGFRAIASGIVLELRLNLRVISAGYYAVLLSTEYSTFLIVRKLLRLIPSEIECERDFSSLLQ